MSFAIASLLTASAIAGPLSPSVRVERVHSPPHVFEGVASIDVNSFEGVRGAEVAAQLRQALADPDRSGRSGPGLVGGLLEIGSDVAGATVGGEAGQLVSGIGGAVAGTAGPKAIRVQDGLRVDVFELKGKDADAVVDGRISVTDKVESYEAKRKKRNAQGKVVKNDKGKPVYETVKCKRRIVNTSVNWRVTGAEQVVLAEETLKLAAKDSKCAEDMGKLKSTSELTAKTLTGIGPRIANQIAPFWTVDSLDYARNKSIREAVKLARDGQLAEAVCAVRPVEKAETYAVEPKLAMGVYLESIGFLNAAASYYRDAASINGHKGAQKRADAVSARIREVEALETAYGLTYTVTENPDYSWCPELPEGRPVVARRATALWDSSDLDGATKVVSIPKGMKLFVTEETASAAKVTTMAGEQGWVPAKHVK